MRPRCWRTCGRLPDSLLGSLQGLHQQLAPARIGGLFMNFATGVLPKSARRRRAPASSPGRTAKLEPWVGAPTHKWSPPGSGVATEFLSLSHALPPVLQAGSTVMEIQCSQACAKSASAWATSCRPLRGLEDCRSLCSPLGNTPFTPSATILDAALRLSPAKESEFFRSAP